MARSFNGSTDWIDAGTASSIALNSNWSASAWIKTTGFSSEFNVIIAKRTSFGGQMEYEFYAGTNGLGAANTLVFGEDGTSFTAGTWYHVAVACDASAANFYVNGSATTPKALDFRITAGTASPVNIGADQGGAQEFFPGTIADVAVWSTKLTAGEAGALGQGARPWTIRPQNLVGWWPLDGLQSPEPDLSGNAANGALHGTSAVTGPPMTMFTPRTPLFSTFIVPPPVYPFNQPMMI